jgi:hypothetical protein
MKRYFLISDTETDNILKDQGNQKKIAWEHAPVCSTCDPADLACHWSRPLRDWRGKWGNGPFRDLNNLTNPIDEFKENRYPRVQARFTPFPRAGTSRCERVTGFATRDMVCSFFFEIEPCLEMDYIRDQLRRHTKHSWPWATRCVKMTRRSPDERLRTAADCLSRQRGLRPDPMPMPHERHNLGDRSRTPCLMTGLVRA